VSASGLAMSFSDLMMMVSESGSALSAPIAFWRSSRLTRTVPMRVHWVIDVDAVRSSGARELLAWLAARLGVQISPPQAGDRKLWQRARELFAAVQARWSDPVAEADGLIAVLLQGAVTLADHSASRTGT
jgi:CRISPR-associated endonuclease/helicase Cas3